MDWHIIRHPVTGGIGVVYKTALTLHKGLGWLRVGATTEMDKEYLDLTQYADAPDLDAPAPEVPPPPAVEATENEEN